MTDFPINYDPAPDQDIARRDYERFVDAAFLYGETVDFLSARRLAFETAAAAEAYPRSDEKSRQAEFARIARNRAGQLLGTFETLEAETTAKRNAWAEVERICDLIVKIESTMDYDSPEPQELTELRAASERANNNLAVVEERVRNRRLEEQGL